MPFLRLRSLCACAAALAAAALLSACAAPERPSGGFWNANAHLTPQQQAVRSAAEGVGDRYRAACVSPRYRAYFSKTACLPNGITPKMLADRTKITREQKAAAEAVFKLADELSEEMRAVMIRTGVPRYIELAEASRRSTDPVVKTLQADLLAGRIAWGEYNARRQALGEEAAREAARLGLGGGDRPAAAAPAEPPANDSLAEDEIDAPEDGGGDAADAADDADGADEAHGS